MGKLLGDGLLGAWHLTSLFAVCWYPPAAQEAATCSSKGSHGGVWSRQRCDVRRGTALLERHKTPGAAVVATSECQGR